MVFYLFIFLAKKHKMKRFSIDESTCGSSVEGGNPSIHPSSYHRGRGGVHLKAFF